MRDPENTTSSNSILASPETTRAGALRDGARRTWHGAGARQRNRQRTQDRPCGKTLCLDFFCHRQNLEGCAIGAYQLADCCSKASGSDDSGGRGRRAHELAPTRSCSCDRGACQENAGRAPDQKAFRQTSQTHTRLNGEKTQSRLARPHNARKIGSGLVGEMRRSESPIAQYHF